MSLLIAEVLKNGVKLISKDLNKSDDILKKTEMILALKAIEHVLSKIKDNEIYERCFLALVIERIGTDKIEKQIISGKVQIAIKEIVNAAISVYKEEVL